MPDWMLSIAAAFNAEVRAVRMFVNVAPQVSTEKVSPHASLYAHNVQMRRVLKIDPIPLDQMIVDMCTSAKDMRNAAKH
jgi:hypothetical protein